MILHCALLVYICKDVVLLRAPKYMYTLYMSSYTVNDLITAFSLMRIMQVIVTIQICAGAMLIYGMQIL